MRGLRYHSTFGVCKTSNNFLVADEKFVYLASSIKVKKNEVIKDNITIFDIKKGKEISVVEMAENELIIDVQLWNNNLLLITTNGLKVVNKPA